MAVSVGEIEATLRLRDQLTGQLKAAMQQIREAGTQLQSMAKSMKAVGGEMRDVGSNLSQAVTLPLVAAA